MGFLSIRLEDSKEGMKKDPRLAFPRSQMAPPPNTKLYSVRGPLTPDSAFSPRLRSAPASELCRLAEVDWPSALKGLSLPLVGRARGTHFFESRHPSAFD